jgi:hypothetical protein
MAEQSTPPAPTPESFETVNGYMKQLHDELKEIKEGKVTESMGRVLVRYRKLILEAAALNLQYQRMMRGRLPYSNMPMKLGDGT